MADEERPTSGRLIPSHLDLWRKAFQYSTLSAPGPELSDFPSLAPLISLDAPRPTEEAFNNVKPRLREEMRVLAMKLRHSLVQLLREVDNEPTTTGSSGTALWKYGQTKLSNAELEAVDAENLEILLHPSALFPVKTFDDCDGYCFHSYPEVISSAGKWDPTAVIRAMRKMRPVAKDLMDVFHLESTNLWTMRTTRPVFRCDCCPKIVHNFFTWNDMVSGSLDIYPGR